MTAPIIAVTKQEAARLIGLSVKTIERRIKSRELPSATYGGRVLIPMWALEKLVPSPPAPPAQLGPELGPEILS